MEVNWLVGGPKKLDSEPELSAHGCSGIRHLSPPDQMTDSLYDS